jgi:hypothetical protein
VCGKEVVPTWSICGVYHRERLYKGDMIFFSPVRQRLEKANIPSYICTGVLVVGEILPDKKALLQDPRISKSYKTLYKLDLRDHLRKDRLRGRPLTAKKRPLHIVLGDPKKSMWFGRNKLDLMQVLSELRIRDIPRSFPRRNNRNVRSLKHEELSRLYKLLKNNLRPIHDRGHDHLDRERLRSCSACRTSRN